MFDWFWEFLYMLAKTIFRLIDGLIMCANKLCGIEPIIFEGEESDFLSYLLFSDEVEFAFMVSAILATILVVIFTVFMIIRSIGKEKAEGTPTQISVKAFKTILMFFLVPAVMIAFLTIGNAFIQALYRATIQNAASPGAFLFSVFAEDGGMSTEMAALFRSGALDYNDTDQVWAAMDLSDFPFLFAWLSGGVVLFGIGSAMLIFVDRVISLVILYIASPISISTSVIDEGARFKLWRDQFLSKFIMGYGMILSINIYALVCGLVMDPDFKFFEGSGFLDLIMKLLIIAGGALTMQKSMAIIGNLVSSGAGSSELRDNALSAGKLAGMVGKAASYTVGLPLRMGKSILGDAISMQSRHLGSKFLGALGLEGGYDKKRDKDGNEEPNAKDKSDSKNGDKAKYGKSGGGAKDAIQDKGFKQSFGGKGDNANNENNKKGDTLNKAIDGGGDKKGNENKNDNGGGDKK